MDEEILQRIDWLFFSNACKQPKASYIEQAVDELLNVSELATFYGVSKTEYIEHLKKKVA